MGLSTYRRMELVTNSAWNFAEASWRWRIWRDRTTETTVPITTKAIRLLTAKRATRRDMRGTFTSLFYRPSKPSDQAGNRIRR